MVGSCIHSYVHRELLHKDILAVLVASPDSFYKEDKPPSGSVRFKPDQSIITRIYSTVSLVILPPATNQIHIRVES